MPKYELALPLLCEVTAYDDFPLDVGSSSWGTRLVAPVLGGTVAGPRLNGTIRPFGADWGIVRADNCLELNVRLLIDTDDGALIHTYYSGLVPMTQEETDQLLAGSISEALDFFVTPRFETGDERYTWLTRLLAVGRGGVVVKEDRLEVTYTWYEVSS
jgi:hypothetical protein